MWYKVEIKLKDESIIERILEAASTIEMQQTILNEFVDQVAYIKGGFTNPPPLEFNIP